MATTMANLPLALPQFDSKERGVSKHFGVTSYDLHIEMLKRSEKLICQDFIMPSRLTHTHI